jgi:hypothetical protein
LFNPLFHYYDFSTVTTFPLNKAIFYHKAFLHVPAAVVKIITGWFKTKWQKGEIFIVIIVSGEVIPQNRLFGTVFHA